MKFEVFDRKEEEEEETVYFDLKKIDEDIYLHQVDKKGNHVSGSNILKITSDGRLKRFCLCEAKGINVDLNGRIKLED